MRRITKHQQAKIKMDHVKSLHGPHVADLCSREIAWRLRTLLKLPAIKMSVVRKRSKPEVCRVGQTLENPCDPFGAIVY